MSDKTDCCKIRTAGADMIEIAIKALDEICALEENENEQTIDYLFNKSISIAGNARRAMMYKAVDLKDSIK